MSITPTAVPASASSRPYAGSTGSFASVQIGSFRDDWACDHMSIGHRTTVGTNGSKRLRPGSFVRILT